MRLNKWTNPNNQIIHINQWRQIKVTKIKRASNFIFFMTSRLSRHGDEASEKLRKWIRILREFVKILEQLVGKDEIRVQNKANLEFYFLLILVQIFFSFYVNVSKAQATNSQSFIVTSYSRQMWWCKREISNLPWPTIPKTFRIWIRKLLWCLPSRFQIATR